MAGVKGRSGRKPNGWTKDENEPGGWVAPPQVPPPEAAAVPPDVVPPADSPLGLLESIMNDVRVPLRERMRAAIAAAQYRHAKRGESGKKEDAAHRAKKAGEGRFTSSEPPRLVAAGGKRTA